MGMALNRLFSRLEGKEGGRRGEKLFILELHLLKLIFRHGLFNECV